MSNRRLRREQERLLKNPKKVQELMRKRPITDEDIEWYIQRQAQKAITEGTKTLGPINLSDELIEELKKHKQARMDEGYDEHIKNYYNTK